MIDELFPIQFIEGINEGEQIDYAEFINMGDWPIVAIKYTANLTYGLYEFDILTVSTINQELVNYSVRVYPDYKNEPNYHNLILADGVLGYSQLLGKRKEDTRKWSKVVLNHSISLISGKTYWLVLISKEENIFLGRGQQGNKIPMLIMAGLSGNWHKAERFQDGWGFMLRFYGRVLPVIT